MLAKPEDVVWRHGEISPALRALQGEILASHLRRA